MKILVSALFIEDYSSYKNGGSGKFMSDLVSGLRKLNHEVIPCSKNDLKTHRWSIFDVIITSHVEILEEVNKHALVGFKIHISQGIIPPQEQMIKGADRYVSISEEVRDHNLNKNGIDSVIIHQPYDLRGSCKKCTNHKKLPLKILHIRGNSCTGSFVGFSNEIYRIVESDKSKPIKNQIESSDLVLALGRGVLDSLSCYTPVIIGDCRSYIGEYGDGLLTVDSFDASLKFNFNGKRFKQSIIKSWMDYQVKKYLTEFIEKDMLELYEKFEQTFECKKIAQKILNLKE